MNSLLYHNSHPHHLSIQVNDKTYNIDHIYFYNDGGIVMDLEYFQDDRSFQFRNETRLRRKLNLRRKENFLIKCPYISTVDNPYILYIYTGNVDIKYRGTEIKNTYTYEGNILISQKYKKYVLGNYVHYQYFKPLSRRLSRLTYKVEKIINNELLYIGDFKPLGEKKMQKTLRKIEKLNKKILKEEEKLKLREKLNI